MTDTEIRDVDTSPGSERTHAAQDTELSAPDEQTTGSADGLFRLRMIVITAMMSVVAVAAGDVFDRTVWWLLIAPAAIGTVALLLLNRRWGTRLAAFTVAIAAAVSEIVLASGGFGSDISNAFAAGPQRLLTTDWPSPDRPDLIGTVALALGIATAVAVLLARRADLHLAPLVPVIVAHVGVIALSSPLGLRVRWLVPLAVLAFGFAVLRPGREEHLRERLTILRGERRLFPVVAIALAVAAAMAAVVVLTDRADPRRNEPAARSAALLDPVEASLALRAIEPPIDLHRLEITDESGAITPIRWRTAALVEYDGTRWAPNLTLRPIGRRLEPTGDGTIEAQVSFLDADLQLVPLPGAPVVVEATIETDSERNIVRLVERPVQDESIRISARLEPDSSTVDGGAIATREIDENSAGLTDLALALAEQGGASEGAGPLELLEGIEKTLREDYVLRSDAAGGGLQRALIERFMRDTRRGNAEQFSTSFVLLARSLGVDARIATGFVVEPSRFVSTDGVTTVTLMSADAAVWPEVHIADDWVAFDPVPEDEATDSAPETPDNQQQTPAAAQPPIVPPPDSTEDAVVTETDDGADDGGALPNVVIWAARIGIGLSALIVPILFSVLAILGIKWRRRRNLLRGPASARIRGAWTVATHRLVDAGMTISPCDTNGEIAIEATGHVERAHRELRRLATLASATTFGTPARPDLLAEDASTCLAAVETALAETRTRWQRLQWRLSLRSLRRRTASPVV